MFEASSHSNHSTPRTSNDPTAHLIFGRHLVLPSADQYAPPRMAPDFHTLSLRQIEILSWIAAGKTDWQVGQILMISAKTVNYHVERAKRSLQVATRTQALLKAHTYGYLALPPAIARAAHAKTSAAGTPPVTVREHDCRCKKPRRTSSSDASRRPS